ncbi:MAG TPA: PIG-L family deacetylase [Planctomycetota bacterium]|nr:PIG-L family deacetylase [Planctomycetota bacterium]
MTRRAVLAIAAHPDDIEFMMAGTLILLRRAGWELHYLNLADGSCGTATESARSIAAKRLREAQAACRLLGARHWPPIAKDLQLYHTTETVARVVAVIRKVRPRIILAQSPTDYMEDHINACRIAVTAAFAQGMRNFPCRPRVAPTGDEVTVYHALPYGLRDPLRRRLRAGQYVDIGGVLADKRAALAAHASQKEWLDVSQGLDAYLKTMEAMSREVGRMSGRFRYAEGWRRRSHLGFSAADSDPLGAALGRLCRVDRRYESELERG